MAKAIIYKPGSEAIVAIVENAIATKKGVIGTNKKIFSKRFVTGDLAIKWAEDSAPYTAVLNAAGDITGYQETVADFPEAAEPGPAISKITFLELADSILKRRDLANLTFGQLDNYIENNVTDLASAKLFLKKLSKVVLAHIKISDYHRE